MKATKLELQQHINNLTTQLIALREQVSVLTTDNKFLREKLDQADIRSKRLIAEGNRARTGVTSERRVALNAARALAMAEGRVVKVDHV